MFEDFPSAGSILLDSASEVITTLNFYFLPIDGLIDDDDHDHFRMKILMT